MARKATAGYNTMKTILNVALDALLLQLHVLLRIVRMRVVVAGSETTSFVASLVCLLLLLLVGDGRVFTGVVLCVGWWLVERAHVL